MNDRDHIYCSVRKKWVLSTPEERVRQQLIHNMVAVGYPLSTLAVEKELRQMPHLALREHSQFPDRRADIICFSKNIHAQHALYPLVLVECKATKTLSLPVIQQAIGYNHFIGAYYIVIANDRQVKTGSYNPLQRQYVFSDRLQPYQVLLNNLIIKSEGKGQRT